MANMAFSPGGQAGQGQEMPGGGMGAGNSGGSLEYTDDNPDSYSAIFDNAVGEVAEDSELAVILLRLKH